MAIYSWEWWHTFHSSPNHPQVTQQCLTQWIYRSDLKSLTKSTDFPKTKWHSSDHSLTLPYPLHTINDFPFSKVYACHRIKISMKSQMLEVLISATTSSICWPYQPVWHNRTSYSLLPLVPQPSFCSSNAPNSGFRIFVSIRSMVGPSLSRPQFRWHFLWEAFPEYSI